MVLEAYVVTVSASGRDELVSSSAGMEVCELGARFGTSARVQWCYCHKGAKACGLGAACCGVPH